MIEHLEFFHSHTGFRSSLLFHNINQFVGHLVRHMINVPSAFCCSDRIDKADLLEASIRQSDGHLPPRTHDFVNNFQWVPRIVCLVLLNKNTTYQRSSYEFHSTQFNRNIPLAR